MQHSLSVDRPPMDTNPTLKRGRIIGLPSLARRVNVRRAARYVPPVCVIQLGEPYEPHDGRLGDRLAGFTLVEMLVVLAIVALLATLSIGALMLAPERARVRGTEALVRKLDGRLVQRLAAFDNQRQSIQRYPADQWFSGTNPSRVEVVAIVRTMRQTFPEYFFLDPNRLTDGIDNDGDGVIDNAEEIVAGDWNPINLVPFGGPPPTLGGAELPAAARAYMVHIKRAYSQYPGFPSHTPATTRAECLYMILTAMGGSGTGVEGETFVPGEVADTDGDGLPEFVDKWGNPIQFFLWPTHYDSPAQKPGTETNPADPNQLLTEQAASGWWAASPQRMAFEVLFHSLSKDAAPSLVPPIPPVSQALRCGYKTYPLIISAGPDQGFGLATAAVGDDGVMGTFDDIGNVDRRAIRITNPSQEGYGMDRDNIDNHHLRAR